MVQLMYRDHPQQCKEVSKYTHVLKTSAHITPAAIIQKTVTMMPMY